MAWAGTAWRQKEGLRTGVPQMPGKDGGIEASWQTPQPSLVCQRQT